MGVLNRAAREDLERAWQSLADKPAYASVRAPEVGMAMVRARAAAPAHPSALAR
jgi:alpha-D-ribose 1-methylphosphonate 5-triphosphate synthase subunit PhnG